MMGLRITRVQAFVVAVFISAPIFARGSECKILSEKRANIDMSGWMGELVAQLAKIYQVQLCFERDYEYCVLPAHGTGQCDGMSYGTLRGKDLTLREALEKLTRDVDSRYTWQAWNCKMVNVFPWRLRQDPDYVMNIEMPSLYFKNKSFDEIHDLINRFLRKKYTVLTRGPIGAVFSGSPEAFEEFQTREEEKKRDLSRPRTFRFHGGSLRDLLNLAVSKLGKTWVWTSYMNYYFNDRPETKPNDYRHEMSMGPGYSLERYDFQQNIEGRRHTPHGDLDRLYIEQTHAERKCRWFEMDEPRLVEINNEPLEHALVYLTSVFGIPIHFESARLHCLEKTQNCWHTKNVGIKGYLPLRQVLDELAGQDGRYTWESWECKAVNVYPKYEDHDPYYIMNLPVEKLELSGNNVNEAVNKLAKLLLRRYRLLKVRKAADFVSLPDNEVSKSVEKTTVRRVLNEIFYPLGAKITWHYRRWSELPAAVDERTIWRGMAAHSVLEPVPTLARTPAPVRYQYKIREVPGRMSESRSGHAAINLGKGRIGVFGGYGKSSMEIYETWTGKFRMLSARHRLGDFSGIRLPGGRALLVDGQHDCVFDAKTEQFLKPVNNLTTEYAREKGTKMSEIVRHPVMLALPGGKIFIAGGADGDFNPIDLCALFDPQKLTFERIGRLAVPRMGHTANLIGDNLVLIAGGRGKSERYKRGVQRKSFDSAELFNLKTGISELLPATMTQPRTYHCAVALRDGNVLIAGGYTPDLPYQDDYDRHDKSAELFDPKTRTFKPVNPMNVPRSNPGADLLPSGRVVVFGGKEKDSTVELYIPEEKQFILLDQHFNKPRKFGPAATTMDSGEIFIVGGCPGSGPEVLDTAEIFTETEPK
ncbi:MAG TPA: kelch repeat-containing protein [Myxococcota bacterium]|nr:kelch repeat-containing protein [Myxococcota bacterium]